MLKQRTGYSEGKREVKLSDLTVEKVADHYFEFLGNLGRLIGVAAGVILSLAGAYALLWAAVWLIFESGRVMTLTGWYGLLIPVGLLTAPMLALKWALSMRKKDAKRRSSAAYMSPKMSPESLNGRKEKLSC